MVLNEKVTDWVKRSVEKEEMQEIVVDFSAHTAGGTMSEIIFVTVSGVTKEREKKVFNLGLKLLRNSLRKIKICILICKIELYMYSTVFPVLTKFLIDKELKKELFSVPKMYYCVDSPTESVIVMQNLKSSGYMLHNKKQHMNMYHLKVVFKELGKFHAISFALRDQKPELFDEITKYLIDNHLTRISMNIPAVTESLKNNLKTALDILMRNGDTTLHEKLCKTFSKPAKEVMIDVLDNEEPQTTICHGDSWNNNFLFKYKGDDQTQPQGVKIIDWQLSGVRSPVFDLSYFLYSSGSHEEFEKFDELLKFYYESFSKFLKKLGSNPQELFTFADLRRHWRSYGISGVITTLNSLKIQLSDEVPDVLECEDSETAVFDLPLNDMELYYSRIKAIVSHYFSVVEVPTYKD